MIGATVLRLVLTAEVALVLALLVTFAAHAVWLWWRRRIDGPRVQQGQADLVAAVSDERGPGANHLARLRRLPRPVLRRVVTRLAVSVTGAEKERLGDVAASLGLVAEAQRRCRSGRWWRRLRAAHDLNVYGRGDEALAPLLDDPHPAVRAQALEWAGDSGGAASAIKLVSALGDGSALCRYTAADSIVRAGSRLVDALATELTRRPEEEQASLLAVLARRPDPRYRGAALAATGDSSRADRRAAGADLLAGVGGADAGEELRRLLTDDDPAVRVAAVDGIRRLAYVPAVPDVAPSLRDPVFAVRRAAGAALAALGPGGILMLRHYLGDSDRYAADMARHALDVAALKTGGGSDAPPPG